MVKWSRVQLGFSIVTAAGLWQTLRERIAFAPKRSAASSARRSEPRSVDISGALHVHSTYSDGVGTVEEIANAATVAGVDFVLLTDHSSLEAISNGQSKWYADGKALIAVGTEITTDLGHVLALRVPGNMPVNPAPLDKIKGDIESHGGFGVVALPCDLKDHWRDFERFPAGYGIEVFNLSSIARTKINIPGLLITIARFLSSRKTKAFNLIASRPNMEIRVWDRLCLDAAKTGRKLPMSIGSLDAHGVMKIARRKFNIPEYSDIFRVLTTHVLLDNPLGRTEDSTERDIQAIFDAIESGASYVCYDIFGDPRGFGFTVSGECCRAGLGEAIVLVKGKKLTAEVTLPNRKCVVRLVRNGEVIAKSRGANLRTVIKKPGIYRVEVGTYNWRVGPFCFGVHPWIFSNPIHVSRGGH